MPDRPIIFSGPMIRALLAGRKTQTRRFASSPLAKAKPGDRLYVREAIRYSAEHANFYYAADDKGVGTELYGRLRDSAKSRPSIHMPRWASRLTLEVAEVRRQRLQDISEADAVAEGMERLKSGRGFYDPRFDHGAVRMAYCDTARTAFAVLWESLHGELSWTANPEVIAISFKVHACNIDAISVRELAEEEAR